MNIRAIAYSVLRKRHPAQVISIFLLSKWLSANALAILSHPDSQLVIPATT